jgi:hypothetical protein
MERAVSFTSVIDHLLRQPGRVLYEAGLGQGGGRVIRLLVLVTVVSLAIFGLLLGSFSGGTQLWAAPVKVAFGTLAAVGICLPSLYIFSALAGAEARLTQVAGLLLTMVALMGLLLLGFAPVVWVFSTSTEAVGFMGFLALAFWLIALFFGGRLLLNLACAFGMQAAGYVVLWMGIFVVVTLQMSTSLRPIIGKSETFLPREKRFFLAHWVKTLNDAGGLVD